jgi:hypothetical protein
MTKNKKWTLKDSFCNSLRWSLVRNLSTSKAVQSSLIWLFIVPISARSLTKINTTVEPILFGEKFKFDLALPFSWQLLFFAALSFTVANIVYQIFCPRLFKAYKTYTEFHDDGKTILQLHSEVKSLVWDNIKPGVKENKKSTVTTYLKAYANTPDVTDENLNHIALEAFDNTKIINSNGIYNNAFYFVQNISDQHNKIAICLSLIFHSLGLCALSTIAIQNITFVLQSILS